MQDFSNLAAFQRVSAVKWKVLAQLDDITSNSQSLDYLAARAGYMKLTLGGSNLPLLPASPLHRYPRVHA